MCDKSVEMSDNANKMLNRLIELMQKKSCFYAKCKSKCGNCDGIPINDDDIGDLADYLLANGAIIPPCKVDDIVYEVGTLFEEKIITELKVIELTIDSKGIKTLYGMTHEGSVYCYSRDYDLNNIKFTKEEAERTLGGE